MNRNVVGIALTGAYFHNSISGNDDDNRLDLFESGHEELD